MEWLYALDRGLFMWINVGWSSDRLDGLFYHVTHLAGQTAGFIFVLIVLAISRSGRSFLYAGLAYGLNAAVFKTIKYTVLRARPHHLPGAVLRQAPELSGVTDPGFPSGHAAVAFMIAVFLSARYPKLSPLFLTLAVLVGLSRIYLGLHYPADVLAGAVIGAGTAGIVLYAGRRFGHLDAWMPGNKEQAA